MKRWSWLGVVLAVGVVWCGLARPAWADDQQKAEKQLHKLTAMASDATGRRVVSATVADWLGAKRPDLVTERRTMNINYGDLYIAHQLVKQGMKRDDLAAQLKSGKKMADIANAQHLDWKQVAGDAKKLNARMEDNLYKHFLNGKADADRDAAEGYDPTIDGVPAEKESSKTRSPTPSTPTCCGETVPTRREARSWIPLRRKRRKENAAIPCGARRAS